jgi:hypothetical protein
MFYRSNRKGTTPVEMAFDATIPLWPGANLVTVVARESPQVQSQQTFVVERTGAPPSAPDTKPRNAPADVTPEMMAPPGK